MILELSQTVIIIAVQVVGLYLLADFVAGIFHWSEDTLGADDTPVWGPLFAEPNSLHHTEPAAMNRIHWLKNNAILFSFAAAVVLIGWLFGFLSWQLVVFAVFGGFSQQAHRFAHAPRLQLPRIVKFLQRIRVLQDARHHWVHHTPPHLTRYCVMTPWVNPVLDKVKFWRAMERIFVPVFGAPRRPDLKDYSWFRSTAIWNRAAET
jgi:ubiquitin-conjugating enzyme E2 variant